MTLSTRKFSLLRLLPLLLAALLSVAVLTGCGDKSKTITETTKNGTTTTRQVADVKFAKTKFVLHSGFALGAFHRYLYKPYQAGSFQAGTPGRTKAFVKAGLASAFILHELKEARRAAQSDDKLRPLVDKIDAVTKALKAQTKNFKNNVLSGTAFTGLDGLFTGLVTDAKGAGANVVEKNAPAIPGL